MKTTSTKIKNEDDLKKNGEKNEDNLKKNEVNSRTIQRNQP